MNRYERPPVAAHLRSAASDRITELERLLVEAREGRDRERAEADRQTSFAQRRLVEAADYREALERVRPMLNRGGPGQIEIDRVLARYPGGETGGEDRGS